MIHFFRKSYRWACLFSILLTGSFAFVMLDTFVIPKSYQTVVTQAARTDTQTGTDTQTVIGTEDTASEDDSTVAESAATEETVSDAGSEVGAETETGSAETTDTEDATDTEAAAYEEPVITETSYEDENIKITIETIREYNSNIYVADIQLSDASYLKTALASGTYGRNIKETTSEMAETNNAVFAINGDYYGFRDYGYVLRNGVLYRDTASDEDALVIDQEGSFSIADEDALESLELSTIWQILSFGPALIENGNIVVDSNSEVDQAMTSNPRTAIGQISELHYIVIVSDGRTDESAGLSLLELAQVFADYGCTTAYNLDGGGSSTMYFNGEVVNVPTSGRGSGEREVSDIVYIGY